MARTSRSRPIRALCAPVPRSDVKTERPEVAISLSEMDKRLMGRVRAAGVSPTRPPGAATDSISTTPCARRPETSYFKGPDAVWVKLVIPTAPTGSGMDPVWPVGYSNQHYGKAISTLFANGDESPQARAGAFYFVPHRRASRGRSRSSLSSGSNAQQHPVVIDCEVLQKRRSRCTTPGELRATRKPPDCGPWTRGWPIPVDKALPSSAPMLEFGITSPTSTCQHLSSGTSPK